jgi:Na+/glutamate symporter
MEYPLVVVPSPTVSNDVRVTPSLLGRRYDEVLVFGPTAGVVVGATAIAVVATIVVAARVNMGRSVEDFLMPTP